MSQGKRTKNYKCCVPRCLNRQDNCGDIFARFPLDVIRCKEWVSRVGCEDLAYVPVHKLNTLRRVCGVHFQDSDFTKENRKNLRRTAIPSVFPDNVIPLSNDILKDFPPENETVNRRHGSTPQGLHDVVNEESGDRSEPSSSSSLNIFDDPVNSTLSEEASVSTSNVPQEGIDVYQAASESSVYILNESTKSSLSEIEGNTYDEDEEEDDVIPAAVKAGVELWCSDSSDSEFDNLAEASSEEDIDVADSRNGGALQTASEGTVGSPVRPRSREDSERVAEPLTLSEEEENIDVPATDDGTPKRTILRKRPRRSEATVRVSKLKLLEEVGLEGEEITPRKKLLLDALSQKVQALKKKCSELRRCKDRIRRLSQDTNLDRFLDKIASPHFRGMVQAHLRNEKRPAKGRRWTLEDKVRCLAILKRSPKGYRYLSYLFPLPSIRTLQRLLRNLPMQPGFNQKLLDRLKIQVERMHPRDRCCVMMFDGMSIKKLLLYNHVRGIIEGYEDYGPVLGRTDKLADHGVVFMLQGLGRRYKQPFGHFFSAGESSSAKMSVLIKEGVRDLRKAGFIVEATVCDQGSTFRGAVNLLQADTRTERPGPFFQVDGVKVFVIHDFPHLMKSIRNNYLTSLHIIWDGKKAKWSHYNRLYKLDQSVFRMNRLSEEHVNPKGKAKMKVSNMTQVFSHNTAASLRMVKYGSSDPELEGAEDTADVTEDLNTLTDIFNGPSGPKDKNPGRKDVSATSHHHQIWPLYKRKVNEMKFVKRVEDKRTGGHKDVVCRPPCQDGLVNTIEAYREVCKDLIENRDFKKVHLRSFNQDPLENTFGVIRQHGITNDNPTCSHFEAALKTCVLNRMSGPHVQSANCEQDNAVLLNDLRDLIVPDSKESADEDVVDRVGEATLLSEELSDEPQPSTEPSTLLSLDDFEPIGAFHLREEDEDVWDFNELGFQHQAPAYVAGYIARKLLQNHRCEVCTNALTTTNVEQFHRFGLEKEFDKNDPPRLKLTSRSLLQVVEDGLAAFQEHIKPIAHLANLKDQVKLQLSLACDFSWLACEDHRYSIVTRMMDLLTKLLTFTFCKRKNEAFKAQARKEANDRQKRHFMGR